MNYDCPPDLDRSTPLSVDSLMLFQRFKQDQDIALVDTLLEQEIAKHRQACELVILHNARSGIFWADLPPHYIDTVELAVCDELKAAGFTVEFLQTASRTTIREGDTDVQVTTVNSRFTAKWLTAHCKDEQRLSAEWQRRLAVERSTIAANLPKRCSRESGSNLEFGDAVWATVVRDGIVAEVQRLGCGSFLCLFNSTGALLHMEPTSVAFDAVFGADAFDATEWQDRATGIIEGWQGTPPDVPSMIFPPTLE